MLNVEHEFNKIQRSFDTGKFDDIKSKYEILKVNCLAEKLGLDKINIVNDIIVTRNVTIGRGVGVTSSNLAFGNRALGGTGSNNIAIGDDALRFNINGSISVFDTGKHQLFFFQIKFIKLKKLFEFF